MHEPDLRLCDLRILFLGENWYGSCARACSFALRRLGCEVQDIDAQKYFPQWSSGWLRAIRRLMAPALVYDYGRAVVQAAERFKPDFLLAFKGHLLPATSLKALRELGVRLYNYFPDTSAFSHGRLLPEALPLYDCVFYTKPFWPRDVAQLKLRDMRLLRHGYDPDIHRRLELTKADISQFTHDVTVIATHTPAKEMLLDELIARSPKLDLAVWGNQWHSHCQSRRVHSRASGYAIEGIAYAKAIQAARINLSLLSGRVYGSSQGDETTTRTYEIPACGGFMLHPRTQEVRELFKEGDEIECFESVPELIEKIEYYLAHSEERTSIAARGHRRCVPAYSYDARMRELLQYHIEHTCTATVTLASTAQT